MDTNAQILRDDWSSWWAVIPPALWTLQGVEHPLRTTPRQKAHPVSLWELQRVYGAEPAYQAVLHCARCFHKELPERDMPAVPATGTQREDLHHWLWTTAGTSATFRVLGACGFRLHADDPQIKPYVSLDWIWLHPYSRHRALFRTAWEIFIRRYPYILLEQPTTAVRISLYGRPAMTLATRDGQELRLYTQSPECAQHGPMRQGASGAWDCYAKLPDGHICTATWVAPKPIRDVPAVRETHGQRTATR